MGKATQLIILMRPQQWYKNLVVFLALIFTSQLTDTAMLWSVTLGFFALCLISSANYALNDLIDRRKDRLHPEKRSRPIASGKVRIWEAILLAVLLMVLGLGLAASLDRLFLLTCTFILAFTQVYSLLLKDAVFVDVLSIGVNFVARAVAGAFILDVRISPWLILCTFFLSLFLSAGKRAAEFRFLGESAGRHRTSLRGYTKETTDMFIMITTTLLIISYSLYSFFSEFAWLLLTLPFALYTILRYTYLVHTGSPVGRHPEKALKDWQIMSGAGLWTLAVVLILHLT